MIFIRNYFKIFNLKKRSYNLKITASKRIVKTQLMRTYTFSKNNFPVSYDSYFIDLITNKEMQNRLYVSHSFEDKKVCYQKLITNKHLESNSELESSLIKKINNTDDESLQKQNKLESFSTFLCSYDEFAFLIPIKQQKNRLEHLIYEYSDKNIILEKKVSHEKNYFTNHDGSKIHIDENLDLALYNILLSNHGFNDESVIRNDILEQSLTYLLKKLKNIVSMVDFSTIKGKTCLKKEAKTSKHLQLFAFFVGDKYYEQRNYITEQSLFSKTLKNFLLEKISNKITSTKNKQENLKYAYTDLSFKLGEFLFEFYIQHNSSSLLKKIFDVINNKNTQDELIDFYIDFLKNNRNLDPFSSIKNDEFFEHIQKTFNIKFNLNLNINSSYFYKTIRNIVIYKLQEHKNIKTLCEVQTHKFYTIFMIKLGSILIESFTKNKLLTKVLEKKPLGLNIENYKRSIMLEFNSELLKEAMHLNLIQQRPYLNKNTLNKLYKASQETVNKTLDNLVLNNHLKTKLSGYITFNKNMKTIIHDDAYLKDPENLTTKFVVDKDYLYFFLRLLKYYLLDCNSFEKLNFEGNLLRYENIFLMYQIPIENILEFYKKYNHIIYVKNCLSELFSVLLDFNGLLTQKFKTTYEELFKQENNIKTKTEKIYYNFLKDLFNKIFSYKSFITGLIKESLLYCDFRYFITDSFIDTRGRCYYNGFYLNPQSYPITKAFIKLYDGGNIQNESNYSDVFNTLLTQLKDPHAINILNTKYNSLDLYKKEKENLQLDYLYNLLDEEKITKTMLQLQMQKFISDSKIENLSLDILNFIKPYVKKIKKLYIIHSIIIRMLYPRAEIQNYYELDATASGLQMTAMLAQDLKLAQQCNLVSSSDTNIKKDIYDQSSSYLITHLTSLDDFITNTLFPISQAFQQKLSSTLDLILCKEISFDTILNYFLEDSSFKNAITNFTLEDIIKKHKWIIKHFIDRNITSSLINNVPQYNKTLYYLIIMSGLRIRHLRNNIKWLNTWLYSRDFFKKPIMTYGYNATSFRRKKEWEETLLELNNQEDFKDLNFIVNIAENIFCKITTEFLKSSQWLSNLGKIICSDFSANLKKQSFYENSQDNIIIKNKFMTIRMYSHKQIKKKITIKTFDTNVQHQLTIKFPKYVTKIVLDNENKNYPIIIKEQDSNLLARKFAPNFIHSMDAFLVHTFKNHLFSINNLLSKHNLFINYMTNHDNFSCTMQPFLKLILIDIYNTTYKYNYIYTLKNMENFSLILKFHLDKIMSLSKGKHLPRDENSYKPLNLKLKDNFVK